MFAVSYLTEKPDYDKISGLTYGTMTSEHKAESRSSWTGLDVALSVLVIALILAAYTYFTRYDI